jgi:hypothetical protein
MNDDYACSCDYEPAEFYHKKDRKARKAHKCEECGSAIKPGQRYEHVFGKWDGRLDSFKTCERCIALRDHLAAHVRCFCWAHGNMLEDARNEVENLPHEAVGTGLLFELGRLAVAIKRAPRKGVML